MGYLISKYISKEILVYLIYVFSIITFIVIFNQVFLVFRESIETPLSISEIFKIVFFKSIADFSLIICLSLFIAILIVLEKFSKSSEFVIFSQGGMGFSRLIFFSSPIVLTSVFFVFFHSLYLAPQINSKIESYRVNALNNLERVNFTKSYFHSFDKGNLTLFIEDVEKKLSTGDETYKNIFIHSKDKLNETYSILLADFGEKNYYNGIPLLNLRNVKKYTFMEHMSEYQIDNYDFLSINLKSYNSNNSEAVEIKNSSISSFELFSKQRNRYENGELFWRMVVPILLLFSSISALFLNNQNIRSSKNKTYSFGFILITIYFSIALFVKSIIENDTIGLNEGLIVTVIGLITVFTLIGIIKNYYVN